MTDTEIHEPEARAVEVSGPLAPAVHRRRASLAAAGILAALAVVAGAAVVTDSPSERFTVSTQLDDETAAPTTAVQTISDTDGAEGQSAPVASVAGATGKTPDPGGSTGETTRIPSTPGALVFEGPDGSYVVRLAADGRCLEVSSGGRTYSNLLCGASAPASGQVVGDAVTLTTPTTRLFLGVAEPVVTELAARSTPAFANGDTRRAVVNGVIYLAIRLGADRAEVGVFAGENSAAMVRIPDGTDRAYARRDLPITVGPPYGIYEGYRRAGFTGFYHGGSQEIGFYDRADGRRCVLHRRLGGPSEALLVDRCLDPEGPVIQAGTLHQISPEGKPDAFAPFAVTLVPAAEILVVLPDGTRVDIGAPSSDPLASSGTWPVDFLDPGGTGFIARGDWSRYVTIPSDVTHVEFVVSKEGDELGRATVAVPRQ